MHIQIQRYRIRDTSCDGILTLDGSRICDTAENTNCRPPAGLYRIALQYNRKQGRKVPTLFALSAPRDKHQTAPFLAIGNGIYNRCDGRIILGTFIAPGCLKNSRTPFMQLYDRINKSIRRGHSVTVEIRDKLRIEK